MSTVRYDSDRNLLYAGSTALPVVKTDIRDLDEPSFHLRRALVGFENGWQLSVVWGTATYSSNHNHSLHLNVAFTEEPTTVEVAIFNPKGDFALVEDQIIEYVDAEGLAWIAQTVSRLPSDTMVLFAADIRRHFVERGRL